MLYDNKKDNFVYDIAFSFAGEQREYVNKVYEILADGYGIKVFYDQDPEIQADLWGSNLIEKLEKVYGEQSRCCIMFISREYNEKFWTNHEKNSVLSSAINEKGTYLLPARFDETKISGILNTTGYIDISNMTPECFSKIVKRKLDNLKLDTLLEHEDEILPIPNLHDDNVNKFVEGNNMKTITMRILEESEIGNMPVLKDDLPDKNAPLIVGDELGNANYVCGACGKTIAANIVEGNISQIVVNCKCGSYNLFE